LPRRGDELTPTFVPQVKQHYTMRGLRALAWLACVGACAGQQMTKPSPRAAKRDAVDAHVSACLCLICGPRGGDDEASEHEQGSHALKLITKRTYVLAGPFSAVCREKTRFVALGDRFLRDP
jgi:hypothetical protein